MTENFSIFDKSGESRDFFFEMQKHSMHLRPSFLARQLAIYELYKRTIELPGSIAEFGVRNGANFFYLARLIELFNSAQREDGISGRHLFGFDTFAGFPNIDERDRSKSSWRDMREGGVPADRDIFFADFNAFKEKSPIGSRLHILEGDVAATLPTFLTERPGVRFAMVYCDLDLYAPTKAVLEGLWDRIVPGGVIVLDEYGLQEFPGESQAADEFLGSKGVALRSIPWCFSPSAYAIKSAPDAGLLNRRPSP